MSASLIVRDPARARVVSPVLPLRAALALATLDLCWAWIGSAETPSEAPGCPDAILPDVRAFVAAWFGLSRHEPPAATVEVALEGFADPAAHEPDLPSGIPAKLRAMVRTGCIGPVVCGLAATLIRDPRLDELGRALGGFYAAAGGDDADEPGPATAGPLAAVAAALQAGADRGVSQAELQDALDGWAAATGGPRVTVNGIATRA